jgi:predicted CXXCH cytochrome family protein
MSLSHRLIKPWTLAVTMSAWSIIFVACVANTQRSPALAGLPDAKIVGAKECATCHAEKVAKFSRSTHSKLFVVGVGNEQAAGCESCHGAGGAHVKQGGGRSNIINPDKNPETCFKCHMEKRGEFRLPNSHPVMAGKVTCSDCHDPHEGGAIMGKGATSLASETETCLRCHTAQKGPYVFKHQAMREGCTACHNPHGTINAKMLVARDANLCLKCHLEHPVVAGSATIMAGGEDHRSRLANGTCWVAGCHEAVHGSNASKALRY